MNIRDIQQSLTIGRLLEAMPSQLGQVFNYVPQYNVMYLLNPKAGCSSFRLWCIRSHMQNPEWQYTTNEGGLHGRQSDPTAQLPDAKTDIGWDRTCELLDGGAYVFSFVRNPIRRLLSAYCDKIARTSYHPLQTAIQAIIGQPEDPTVFIEFDDFLTALELQDQMHQNNHWRPQHINILHGMANHSMIGKLENFGEDFPRLCEETGMPHDGMEIVHKRAPATIFDDLISGRPDRLKRIEQLYAKDMEIFGY